MHETLNPAILKAVQRTIGHRPPFTPAELESVDDLHISSNEGLAGLDALSSLELLILVACDPVDTAQLSRCKSLSTLTARLTGMADLGGLAELNLLSCYVPQNCIRDIDPLMNISRLRNLDVTGNPLSEHTYNVLIPELRERGCRVIMSERFEWGITRRFHDAGIPISCYGNKADSRDGYRLGIAGLRFTESPHFGHPYITTSQAEALTKGDLRQAFSHFEHDVAQRLSEALES
ncbi:hypothetical protein [Streptomyces sp. MMS24-I29]|uniref:hypothetical protein n=1 Tax=Streptomyces sp. MMS24-I29 TaxID=3351480 RepID=UPI003C7B5111